MVVTMIPPLLGNQKITATDRTTIFYDVKVQIIICLYHSAQAI